MMKWHVEGARVLDAADDSQRKRLSFEDGCIEVSLPNGDRIQIEMYRRHDSDVGIRVRGRDAALDIEPEVANCIVIKSRGRW